MSLPRRLPIFAVLVLALACAAPLSADPAAVGDRIVALGTVDNRVMQHLDALVNDIGPRLTGSTNLARAEEWALQTFQSYGLEARLEPWGELPLTFDRGIQRGVMIAPEPMELEFLSYAWTSGTDGAVRGPAVRGPTNPAEFEQRREEFRGAWLLLGRGARSNQSLREAINAAADELGIAGVIGSGNSSDLVVMSGRMPAEADAVTGVPSLSLVASQYDAITERLDDGEIVELEFEIENIVTPGPITQHNVIADLIGSTYPDEYVIVGGHLDSWDGATGTTDNGTGCATTIEAARLLVEAGARPQRTIRFMLWGGEEQGLIGSRAWVSEHPELMDDISAVIVHDGGTNYLSGIASTPSMMPQLQQALAPVVAFSQTEAAAGAFEVYEVAGLTGGGSDHAAFLGAGVPGFFWRQSGDANYTHTHHTQHDTYEAAIEPYQRHSSIVVALGALGIANLPGLLDRNHMQSERRTLGVYLDGMTITQIVPGSRAEAHGLAAGDELLTVNGEPIGESLRNRLQVGEGRKLIGWRRGADDELRSAIFNWDHGDVSHAPERVELSTSDGLALQGDFYLGSEDGPAQGSAVILLHMYKSDRNAWAPLREPLYEAGIASFALDLRGHGGSVDEEGSLAARVADRDAELFNAMDRDVAAAVTWLESLGYDAERIGLMGASVGCSVALSAAVEDARLAGVAALTPGTDYLGVDSLADIARWDGRPLLLVSSEEEAGRGAQPLHEALATQLDRHAAELLILSQADVHGTNMFGRVPEVESRLAGWLAERL